MGNSEIENEIDDIRKSKKKIYRKDLIYRENKNEYGFQQYETIRSFGDIFILVKLLQIKLNRQSIRKLSKT